MIDCVVVGAGPAGLATSAALAERAVEHVVLERSRVGETWRTQRWDSFRLNSPGWANVMLGEQAGDAYLTGPEVIGRLERIAGDAPVRAGVRVTRLRTAAVGFALVIDDGEIRTETVVVATGHENLPRTPALAAAFPDRVVQLHTADYRAPGRLPEGAVLVVGGGQSGCQITEDLLSAGRRAVLATSPVGWSRSTGGRRGSTPVFLPTWPPVMPSPPRPGRWSTRPSSAPAWTCRLLSPTMPSHRPARSRPRCWTLPRWGRSVT